MPTPRNSVEVPKTKWWEAILGWLVILFVLSLFYGWDYITYGLHSTGFL